MRKIILFFQIIIIMLPAALYAQTKTVTGTVRDGEGILPGATVVEKGLPANGVTTDGNGKFKITMKGTSEVLIVRFIGDVTREINVAGKNTVDVIMSTNSHGLDEVSVVGFGKTTRITNTGAVSSINAAEVREIPTANVQNTLAGRLPGFFSQQSSGQPGKDASDFFIRGISSLNPAGNQPLIIVDDIEYTYDQLQQINVNEIETISILKDASTTAIYGIKGANGVLVVTTRRGKAGTPKINFRAETGIQSNTITPVFLDAYQSALLVNQAEANDNLALPAGQAPRQLSFTQNDLNLFKSGTDPYGHPNVDWYNEIVNKYSYQTNANLDISGGNEQVKYFISGGALNQDGDVKNFPDPRGELNNNYYFTRYNFRSNLDMKANKTLDLRLDVTTRFSDLNQPLAEGAVGQLYDFTKETPFTAPFLNPNGSFAYAYSPFNSGHLPTLNARLASGGNDNSRRTDYNVLFNAVQKLDAFTPGLSATARVAYSSVEQYSAQITPSSSAIPSYHYDPVANTYTLNPSGAYVFPTYSQTGQTDFYTTDVNIQLFANYDRTFGSLNHVTGLFLLNQDSNTTYANNTIILDPTQVAVPAKFRGLSMRGGYDYAGKYLFDINAAYNGTDRFAANHRYGWFPAVSLGYALNKEDYFKNLFPAIGLFKIRGSYGIVGSDAAPGNRYVYNQYYTQGGGYNFGQSEADYNSYYENSLSNPNVVWERQKELDLGLDMNLLKDNKLSVTFDYFHNIRYDQLITPANVSEVLGVGLPAVNVGKTQNQGFDGQIGYHSNIGKVQFATNFVFSYAKNKILYEDEPQPASPNEALTGWPINQPIGYHFVGYYTAAEAQEINTYEAAHGGNNKGNSIAAPIGEIMEAGDLKYYDFNHDGVIDEYDKTHIGHPNLPNTTLGLNLQASYKGFSISVLFQGSFNYSFIVTGTGIEPFQSQFQPIDLQAWTPSNAANAQFPRLTQVPNTVNSPTFYPSDYWLVNAYYIRLKTLELRYVLPSKLLPFHLTAGSIYLSCYNLITWDNYDKYQQDPEISTNTVGDAYINQRVVNLGVQFGF